MGATPRRNMARLFAFIILIALTALALAVLGAPSSPEEVVPETALADVPAKPPVDVLTETEEALAEKSSGEDESSEEEELAEMAPAPPAPAKGNADSQHAQSAAHQKQVQKQVITKMKSKKKELLQATQPPVDVLTETEEELAEKSSGEEELTEMANRWDPWYPFSRQRRRRSGKVG